jgi:GNAT superfamily N-acetyltransferase
VEEEFRGKKIGKTLLSQVIQKLRDAGIHKCHIMVYKNNLSGKAIWEKSGWTLRNDLDIMSKEITDT